LKKFETDVTHKMVNEIMIHGDWKTYTKSYDGDIAILLLEKDVEFKQNIQPICLPPLKWKNKGLESGTIVGWGLSERSNRSTVEEIPRKTQINKPPTNEQCFYEFNELVQLSSPNTFCAIGNSTGPCAGDSGELLKEFVTFKL
jgi:hypothetical protein